jgi:hypothetical protein
VSNQTIYCGGLEMKTRPNGDILSENDVALEGGCKMKSKSLVHVVGTECPPEMEKKYDQWYSERHVPDVLKFKKLKSVTRLKKLHSEGEAPKFLTFYEFDSEKDYQDYIKSPERAAAGPDWVRVQKELKVCRTWFAQYEVIKGWNQ